jgi:hypothetical protein
MVRAPSGKTDPRPAGGGKLRAIQPSGLGQVKPLQTFQGLVMNKSKWIDIIMWILAGVGGLLLADALKAWM